MFIEGAKVRHNLLLAKDVIMTRGSQDEILMLCEHEALLSITHLPTSALGKGLSAPRSDLVRLQLQGRSPISAAAQQGQLKKGSLRLSYLWHKAVGSQSNYK